MISSNWAIPIVRATRYALFFVFTTASFSHARAQTASNLLLVSQPATGTPKEQFVDLSPHLQPALQETGKYNIIVYRSTLSAVQDAVKSGQLKAEEIESPISREAAHRIARALDAGGILHVSATSSKEGIGMSAELEAVIGQNTWNQVYLDQVAAGNKGGKRSSLLESIHGIVDRIVQKLTTSNVQTIGAQKPVDVPKSPSNPGEKGAGEKAAGDTPAGQTGDNAGAKPARGDVSLGPTKGGTGPVQNTQGGTKTVPPGTAQSAQPAAKTNNLSTYALLVDRARRNGDLASLIVALRKAINEQPGDVRLRRDLASAYKDRGSIDMAKEELLRAAALAPEDGSVHRLMGDVLMDAGDRPGALKEYQTAVRMGPQDAASHISLGDALSADGHPEEAAKEFLAAAQADPKSPTAHVRLARLDVSRGAYTDAVAELTAAKSLVASGDNSAFLSDCAAILGVVESTLIESMPRLQQTRVAFNNGTKSREEAFKTISDLRKQIDAVATFLDAMPDVGLTQPQALYSQAASLALQAIDKLLEHLETQSTSAAEESNILRIEANKQIGEASKRLKSMLESKSARR